MHWAARFGELARQKPGAVLAGVWLTLASLIELHMRAEEEICRPAVLGTAGPGRVVARQIRAHAFRHSAYRTSDP
jgi:hypothetical protein